jgi:Membrane protein involved in the export of O-antigen and teichoic acid
MILHNVDVLTYALSGVYYMMNQSSQTRTAAYSKNLQASLFCHFITLVMSFISRSIFITYLGKEYLGLSGLFTNVLSIISLVELGLGQGIAQTLYKPIAQNNITELAGIMTFFQKAYNTIGVITGVLGLAAAPFLKLFVHELPNIPNIYIAYMIYVVHSAFSYFFIPKRLLVIYDQRMYVTSILSGIFYTLVTVGQIFVLVFTGNYILYLVVRISLLILEDMSVSLYANKRYPFLKKKERVTKEYSRKLFRTVKALLCHKIGRVICRSTDSILISSRLGLSAMGMYSNYALILGACGSIIGLIIGASSAGVGNLGASAKEEKSEEVFRTIFFANFWLNTVCAIPLLTIINPIIAMWLGKDMLFSFGTVIVIIICFFVSNMRDPCLIFRNSYGLFHEERYKPLIEAAFNIILSLAFVGKFGVAGVYLGTVLSEVLVCVWFEPYVLYKYGFKLPVKKFAITYLSYFIVFIFISVCSFQLSLMISVPGISGVIYKGFFCFVFTNVALLLFFFNTKELKGLSAILKRAFFRLRKAV